MMRPCFTGFSGSLFPETPNQWWILGIAVVTDGIGIHPSPDRCTSSYVYSHWGWYLMRRNDAESCGTSIFILAYCQFVSCPDKWCSLKMGCSNCLWPTILSFWSAFSIPFWGDGHLAFWRGQKSRLSYITITIYIYLYIDRYRYIYIYIYI